MFAFSFSAEVITVALATTVCEPFALVRCFIKVPPIIGSAARAFFFGLRAHVSSAALDASIFALLAGFELVVVAQATVPDELRAMVLVLVVVPFRVVAVARAGDLAQFAPVFSWRVHAH